MDSRSDTQKNQKTGLPPMKLRLLDMDEATNVNHPKFNYFANPSKVCPI
jgi:hypothetical protein